MLRTVFQDDMLTKATFMPAMHKAALPYQYSLFLNYTPNPDSLLNHWNPEVPIDFKTPTSLHHHHHHENNKTNDKPLTGTSLTFDELLKRELLLAGREQ